MDMNKYINRCGLYIYRLLRLENTSYGHKIRGNIQKINMVYGNELEDCTRQFWLRQIKRSVAILAIVLVMLPFIKLSNSTSKENIRIERNGYGGEEKEFSFEIEGEGIKSRINVNVPAVMYSDEMLVDIIEDISKGLEKRLLGNNDNLETVITDLYMPEDTEYEGIGIKWSTSDYNRVSRDGSVLNADINKPVEVAITADIVYEDIIKEIEYKVIIYPKVYTEEELIEDRIRGNIETLINEDLESAYIEVPPNIDGIDISSTSSKSNSKCIIVLMLLLAIPLLYFKEVEEINSKIKSRNGQLLKEYPNFINKLVLLLGAGMNVKSSIHKMVEKKPSQKNYLYEELIITVNELNAGVSETVAYYNLGRRIGMPAYLKISTLIIQNVKLGSKGLLQQLEQEEVWAFEQRKEYAKKLGEEAGTKLLFPMIIQMLIVMIIIMIPALLDFNI